MHGRQQPLTSLSPQSPQSAALCGFGPAVDAGTRLVVLGSFPGEASLTASQYYAHPRNQFWRLLSELWEVDLVAMPYEQRLTCANAHQVGLWDVYAACEREGSLDSAIRKPEWNELALLTQLAPQLQAIVHNGGESAKAMRITQGLGVAVYRLPSTSPANASWSFERKLAAWREVFAAQGVA